MILLFYYYAFLRVKEKRSKKFWWALVAILLSLVTWFHATGPIEKSSPPKIPLSPTPIGFWLRLLIGGFFFYSTLLHKVPADPPMGLSEYRLDQALSVLGGLLVRCSKGSGRTHRLLGQTSKGKRMYKPIARAKQLTTLRHHFTKGTADYLTPIFPYHLSSHKYSVIPGPTHLLAMFPSLLLCPYFTETSSHIILLFEYFFPGIFSSSQSIPLGSGDV